MSSLPFWQWHLSAAALGKWWLQIRTQVSVFSPLTGIRPRLDRGKSLGKEECKFWFTTREFMNSLFEERIYIYVCLVKNPSRYSGSWFRCHQPQPGRRHDVECDGFVLQLQPYVSAPWPAWITQLVEEQYMRHICHPTQNILFSISCARHTYTHTQRKSIRSWNLI